MRTYLFGVLTGTALALALPNVASAQSITMTGDYIQTAVNEAGTLGSGGSTSPGLQHDPMGTGTFGVDDYLTPGSPHEGFSINSLQTGFRQNDNKFVGFGDFGTAAPVALVGAAAMGFDNAVSWSGSLAGFLDITHSYFYNNGDERIRIETTITALSDLTDLAFARSLDPDPDVNTFGSFATNNQRGNSLFSTADFIGAAGPETGLTVALVNGSGSVFTHNTMIGNTCCDNVDPYAVLLGSVDNTFADQSINMAWRIGNLLAGNSASLTYFYAVGDRIEDTGGGGGTGAVPEPSTWMLMMMGFFGTGLAMRRRKTKVSVAYA